MARPFFFIAVFAVTASATLTTIGTATSLGSNYSLIWDSDNNGNSLVWLDFTNATANWADQNAWAAGLNVNGSLTYQLNGYQVDLSTSTWRLPSAGVNSANSEMGGLWYELGESYEV